LISIKNYFGVAARTPHFEIKTFGFRFQNEHRRRDGSGVFFGPKRLLDQKTPLALGGTARAGVKLLLAV
jgi:hypothetical protein